MPKLYQLQFSARNQRWSNQSRESRLIILTALVGVLIGIVGLAYAYTVATQWRDIQLAKRVLEAIPSRAPKTQFVISDDLTVGEVRISLLDACVLGRYVIVDALIQCDASAMGFHSVLPTSVLLSDPSSYMYIESTNGDRGRALPAFERRGWNLSPALVGFRRHELQVGKLRGVFVDRFIVLIPPGIEDACAVGIDNASAFSEDARYDSGAKTAIVSVVTIQNHRIIAREHE